MALWGKTDNLAGTPKFVARKAFFDSTAVGTSAETINILSSNTGFATGDAVYYDINGGTVIGGLANGTTYFVRVVGAGLIELYDTYDNAVAQPANVGDPFPTTGRLDITGAGVGTHTLQRTGAANVFGDHNYNGHAIVFVDREESQRTSNRAKGLVSPGWWLYKTYTDTNSVTRHKSELLVAIDVTAGAAGDAEDVIVPDLTITFGTQPSSQSIAAPNPVTFTVAATTNGTIGVTYQWQVSTNGGSAWTNVSGATSASYTIADVTGLNLNQYRAVATAGTITANSNAATLTVT